MLTRTRVACAAATLALTIAWPALPPLQAQAPAAKQPATKAPAKAAAGTARTIQLQGTDTMKFVPDAIQAKPGETLRIVLTGVGKMPKVVMAHNFVLLTPKADVTSFVNESMKAQATGYMAPGRKADVLAATGMAGAGETVEVTFKAPAQPGSYTFVCTFPGHFAAGMKGTLVVK